MKTHCRGLPPHLQAEPQPGFINALLDILQGEQNNAVQLSGRQLVVPFGLPVNCLAGFSRVSQPVFT